MLKDKVAKLHCTVVSLFVINPLTYTDRVRELLISFKYLRCPQL